MEVMEVLDSNKDTPSCMDSDEAVCGGCDECSTFCDECSTFCDVCGCWYWDEDPCELH